MSPFASLLHEIRTQRGLRQFELAEMMGYEKSYISSLEIGTKGPPTLEFVERLVTTLQLDAEEQRTVLAAYKASERKLVLGLNSSAEIYWLVSELRDHIDALHPAQIRMFRDLLKMPDLLQTKPIELSLRFEKGRKEEARM